MGASQRIAGSPLPQRGKKLSSMRIQRWLQPAGLGGDDDRVVLRSPVFPLQCRGLLPRRPRVKLTNSPANRPSDAPILHRQKTRQRERRALSRRGSKVKQERRNFPRQPSRCSPKLAGYPLIWIKAGRDLAVLWGASIFVNPLSAARSGRSYSAPPARWALRGWSRSTASGPIMRAGRSIGSKRRFGCIRACTGLWMRLRKVRSINGAQSRKTNRRGQRRSGAMGSRSR
jgi:hypothetical protein